MNNRTNPPFSGRCYEEELREAAESDTSEHEGFDYDVNHHQPVSLLLDVLTRLLHLRKTRTW